MTVDEAIAYALVIRDAEDERDLALVTLAAEVRRLRAAVEQVKEGNWITRFDVIAILEGTDDA